MGNIKNISKKIIKIIKDNNISFIGSIDENGFPSVRAMLRPRKFDNIYTFWFLTTKSTNKVQHILNNNKTCLYFYDKNAFQGACLKGTMQIFTDKEHKALFWQKSDDLLFQNGINDPEYCILKFTTEKVRFYENFESQDYIL